MGKAANTIYFNGTAPQLLRDLIVKYGESETMFSGTNTEGEQMTISIDARKGIITRTFQHNGWVRVNYYGTDGHPEGESFDGKWVGNTPDPELGYVPTVPYKGAAKTTKKRGGK